MLTQKRFPQNHEPIFNLRIDKNSKSQLKNLSKKYACSKAEVVRRAVKLLGLVEKESSSGNQFLIKNTKSGVEQLILIA